MCICVKFSKLARRWFVGLWVVLFSNPLAAQLQSPPADLPTLTFLTRTTIVALNHANRTGNYSVLREIGAPSFSAANTAADLAVAFTDLRNQGLDLNPIVLFDPQFVRPPQIDRLGRLNMAGYFPSAPLRINFEMIFEPVDGRWRLFGLSVNPVAAPAAAAQTNDAVQAYQTSESENAGAITEQLNAPTTASNSVPVPQVNPERFSAQ